MTRLILLFVGIFCLNTAVLHAQTHYTSNGSSTDWATATAWTPNGVPDITDWPNDRVTINHDMTFTGNLNAKAAGACIVNNGATLTVTGSFTVNQTSWTVAAGGALSVGTTVSITNTGTFTNAGTITSVGKFDVDGGSFTSTGGSVSCTVFEAGSGANSIVNLTATTINATSDLNIIGDGRITANSTSPFTVGGNLNNTGNVSSTFGGSIGITGNIANTGSSNLTFNGTSTVGGGITGSGSTLITVGGTLAVTGTITLGTNSSIDGTGVVSWGGIDVDGNGGSSITCADNSEYDSNPTALLPDPPANPLSLASCGAGVLPVELLEFSALLKDELVILKWVTGSEINVSHFEVQSSNNGIDWETLQFITATGNSSVPMQYSTEDDRFLGTASVKYYRIKIVDNTGIIELSPLRKVNNSNSDFVDLYYTESGLNVQINAGEESGVFTVLDLMGQIVFQQNIIGDTHFLLSGNYFSSKGCYVANFSSNNTNSATKFTVK